MFEYIKGKVVKQASNYIVIENNNIGYIIHTASPYSFHIDEELCIFTYTHIREDVFDIYGFKTTEERDIFNRLLTVKGIGPKGALAIIARGDLEGLQKAIDDGDVKYLQKYPGIGQKASGQIILDLKGKLLPSVPSDPKIDQVKEALRSLGYNTGELKRLDNYLQDNKNLTIEQLIKESLKKLL